MSTPRTPNQKKQNAALKARLAKYGKLIEQVYDKFNREAAQIAMRTDFDPDGGKVFRFQDYPITREAVKALLDDYVSDVIATVNRTTSEEWQNSNEFQDLVANKVLKAYGVKSKEGDDYERYYQANSDHLKAFQTRASNGMNLSKRVWNLREQYKQELEMGLSVGIERGTSAASLAKQMKQYLNEPDKLFRRVRDKYGNLQLSKNAAAYHPGRGIYRSSYKNAMRLTRSEANMAYRSAEQARWQQFDFVVGYEIKTTQNGRHVEDICDTLAGKYPKDFQWTGWHPQCMCYRIPILKTEEEFWATNSEDSTSSINEVKDVPERFKDWVKDNKDRLDAAEKRRTTPYFIADNKGYVNEALSGVGAKSGSNSNTLPHSAKKTPLEIAAERHAARTQEDIDRIQSEWNTNRMSHLIVMSERIGSYRDADFRELASLLDMENSMKDFSAFRADYLRAKKYVEDKIAIETALARKFMENPLDVQNMKELAKVLGITQGDYMTFFEANVLRGNPNYEVSAAYRINCQTCVVAHELRRRGFNVEALANIKGSWLEKLSYKTNEIWIDADGNIPQKTCIGAKFTTAYTKNGRNYGSWDKTVSNRKQLIKELESSITEDGRYHIDWIWNSQSKRLNGHIITLEKIGDKIRYYDPQNGVVIDNFYDYIKDIKLNRGINILRVDNLRINPDYAAHILGKSGSKAISGKIGNNVTQGAKINLSGDIKTDIADYVRERNKATSYHDRIALDLQIIKEGKFIRSNYHSSSKGSIFATEELPKRISKDDLELSKNIQMAKKMANNGYDCYLLSNPHGTKSADFLFVKDGKVLYTEGKLSTGKNSLGHNLSKGGSQSERLLIDLTGTKDTNYISARLEEAFENNDNLKEVMLLKGGRLISVKATDVRNKSFQNKFKKVWEQNK